MANNGLIQVQVKFFKKGATVMTSLIEDFDYTSPNFEEITDNEHYHQQMAADAPDHLRTDILDEDMVAVRITEVDPYLIEERTGVGNELYDCAWDDIIKLARRAKDDEHSEVFFLALMEYKTDWEGFVESIKPIGIVNTDEITELASEHLLQP